MTRFLNNFEMIDGSRFVIFHFAFKKLLNEYYVIFYYFLTTFAFIKDFELEEMLVFRKYCFLN